MRSGNTARLRRYSSRGRARHADRKPATAIYHDFFVHVNGGSLRIGLSAFDDFSVPDELNHAQRISSLHIGAEPRPVCLTSRYGELRAHRLPVNFKSKQRAIGDKNAAFPIASEPAGPVHRGSHFHILTGGAGNAVYAAPVGEHVRSS